ncbi:hypothetical protein HWV62_6979 [Athelia sp. TMB]|nr:hypothetical protein HWV62_6979 [Athelia sp. TMB]
MDSYESIQALHKALPPFAPYIPVALLPYFALVLLSSTFALAFYFSTRVFDMHLWNRMPKDTLPIRETAVATTASVLAGFGVVALFNSAGVYV